MNFPIFLLPSISLASTASSLLACCSHCRTDYSKPGVSPLFNKFGVSPLCNKSGVSPLFNKSGVSPLFLAWCVDNIQCLACRHCFMFGKIISCLPAMKMFGESPRSECMAHRHRLQLAFSHRLCLTCCDRLDWAIYPVFLSPLIQLACCHHFKSDLSLLF